jgi:hypothetical protein
MLALQHWLRSLHRSCDGRWSLHDLWLASWSDCRNDPHTVDGCM